MGTPPEEVARRSVPWGMEDRSSMTKWPSTASEACCNRGITRAMSGTWKVLKWRASISRFRMDSKHGISRRQGIESLRDRSAGADVGVIQRATSTMPWSWASQRRSRRGGAADARLAGAGGAVGVAYRASKAWRTTARVAWMGAATLMMGMRRSSRYSSAVSAARSAWTSAVSQPGAKVMCRRRRLTRSLRQRVLNVSEAPGRRACTKRCWRDVGALLISWGCTREKATVRVRSAWRFLRRSGGWVAARERVTRTVVTRSRTWSVSSQRASAWAFVGVRRGRREGTWRAAARRAVQVVAATHRQRVGTLLRMIVNTSCGQSVRRIGWWRCLGVRACCLSVLFVGLSGIYLTLNQPKMSGTGGSDFSWCAAAHYDSHATPRNEPRAAVLQRRARGPLYELKKLHNGIKRWLIAAHCSGAREYLDVGCGRGGDIQKLRDARVCRVTGIDVSSLEIAEAQRRVRETRATSTSFRFVCAPALAWTAAAPSEAFDAVGCMFCIHYFFGDEESARGIVRHIARLLRAGGVFVGCVPDAAAILRFLAEGSASAHLTLTPHWPASSSSLAQPTYGMAYTFDLQDTVTARTATGSQGSTEYLVCFENLVSLAREHGLELVHTGMFEPPRAMPGAEVSRLFRWFAFRKFT